jgi:hypothetical protein
MTSLQGRKGDGDSLFKEGDVTKDGFEIIQVKNYYVIRKRIICKKSFKTMDDSVKTGTKGFFYRDTETDERWLTFDTCGAIRRFSLGKSYFDFIEGDKSVDRKSNRGNKACRKVKDSEN